ncbi:MAG: hypothetical protein ACI9OU_002551 [Candidatus Promineifilaceae bacterium]|jgi:hypothetical protein
MELDSQAQVLRGSLKPLADYTFDGRSLVPILRNPNTRWPERTIVPDSQRVRDPIKWRKSSTMTQRWRLINGTELYDKKSDPGQKKDLANKHPEIVKKLRADYEAWWADISPVFKFDTRMILGNPAENPSRLTCHDWLTKGKATPWHQRSIRDGHLDVEEWALKVEKAGVYEITLRRWPETVNAAISGHVPAGLSVPGLRAYRETPGKSLDVITAGIKIGAIAEEKPVKAEDTGVTFTVELSEGDVNLFGYFVLENGWKFGSYYADVKKLP